jgi:nucleoid-associated protein YgaU
MGILTGGDSVKNAGGFLGLGANKGVAAPKDYPDDFPEGLVLVEIVDGKEKTSDQVQLVGRFSPHQPFEFGGSQALSKEYYPGNSEPTVQVLGSREQNVPIKGRLKSNKFKNEDLREAAVEYQELIDAMRLRGNLVKATLGEWRRYGFIESVTFRMNTRQDIEYEIDFFVVGFNPPTLDKTTKGDGSVTAPNKEIIAAAAQALINAQNFPSEMPLSVADRLNNLVSDVAEKINLVTNFVEGIQNDVNSVVASANRAIGLIKNARAFISRTTRNVGSIAQNVSGLAGSFANEAEKTANTLRNVSHLHKIHRDYSSLALLLATLQARFAGLATTVPMVRHLVRQGDSLQTLAQKYYGNAELWQRIYTHNRLTTTTLVVGSVLEIPKL